MSLWNNNSRRCGISKEGQEAMKWPRWQDGATGDKPAGEAKATWNIHQSDGLQSHDDLGTSRLIFRCAAPAAARLARRESGRN
jgi:hypothetical protein